MSDYKTFIGGKYNAIITTDGHINITESQSGNKDSMLVVRMRPDIKAPERAEGNAGYDLFCPDRTVCKANAITKIGSGLKIRPPMEHACMIVAWDKSSVAAGNSRFKGYLTVVAGLFDSSYQGEYIIALLNESDEDIVLEAGQKFVQLVIIPILTPRIIVVESVKDFGTDDFKRKDGGFGSTGDGVSQPSMV